MDGEELLDWELVHGSDTGSTDSISSEKKSGSSSIIDDGMILSDNFMKVSEETTDLSQYGVLESSSSFRVDYGLNRRHDQPKEVLVESSSSHSPGDVGVRKESGSNDDECSGDNEASVSDFEAADEKHAESEDESHIEDSTKCLPQVDNGRHVESQSGVDEPIEDSSKSWSHSGGNELVSGDSGIVNGEDDIVSDSEAVEKSGGNTVDVVAVRSGDESKSRETVWWKMPFVLVKYCALRIGPVWSVSMAAALMGLVLLGRRLYNINMKNKAQSFHLKVAIDDKKVSRVMNQAARLNEMFPVIRPALPSPGAWPVLMRQMFHHDMYQKTEIRACTASHHVLYRKNRDTCVFL